MRKLKKLLSIAMSVGMIATSAVATMPANTVSATSITFKQGDVNGDGSVTIADLTAVSQYLSGNRGATAQQITRMDATQNKVIEEQDRIMIYDCIDGYTTPQTVTADVYTNVDDSSRTYYVYDCETTNRIGNYTLSANSIPTNISTYVTRFENTDDYPDYENTNTVQVTRDFIEDNQLKRSIGSGFIVDDHVIATAAHCVYNENGCLPDLKIRVCNAISDEIAVYDAKTIHVPHLYEYYLDGSYWQNYDYALIYVEEDLSQYGKWSLGCMTTEFMATGSDVTASGFTGDDDSVDKPFGRYYSRGAIDNFNQDSYGYNNKNLTFHSLAKVYGCKSGGPVYYESDYDDTTIRTVVGITSHYKEDQYGNTDNTVWGTKITPTLLKFFLNNPNIESYVNS